MCILIKEHGEGMVIVLASGKLLFAVTGHSMLMHLSLHPAHPLVLRCTCLPDLLSNLNGMISIGRVW